MSDPNYRELIDAAIKSAKLASSDDSLDDALFSYVDTMELEPGVSRGAVYEHAKGLLKL
jgi:hypothetical protein